VKFSTEHTDFGTGAFFFAFDQILVVLSKFVCCVVLAFVELRNRLLFIVHMGALVFFFLLLFLFRRQHVNDGNVLDKAIFVLNRTCFDLGLFHSLFEKISDQFRFLTHLKRLFNFIKAERDALKIVFQLLLDIDHHFIDLDYFQLYQRRDVQKVDLYDIYEPCDFFQLFKNSCHYQVGHF
jgi:hypothetical protein